MKPVISIAMGGDHASPDMKKAIIAAFPGLHIKDFGTYTTEAVDYPDFAHPVALAVESGEFALGILICGSANGVAITANKHQGIRAAICWLPELATLARSHNNANIVCLPARFISTETALEIIKNFLSAEFEGGRHDTRVKKIAC